MPSQLNTNRTLAIVISALGICSACGIGMRNEPPPPPPSNSQIFVSTHELHFPATAMGQTSSTQQFVLTNREAVPIFFEQSPNLVPQSDFLVTYQGCHRRLDPAATCTVNVAFHPSRPGSTQAEIFFYFANFASIEVELNGTSPVAPVSSPH